MNFLWLSHDFLINSHDFLNWPWFEPFWPLFSQILSLELFFFVSDLLKLKCYIRLYILSRYIKLDSLFFLSLVFSPSAQLYNMFIKGSFLFMAGLVLPQRAEKIFQPFNWKYCLKQSITALLTILLFDKNMLTESMTRYTNLYILINPYDILIMINFKML